MKTNFEYTGGADCFISAYVECALWSSTDEEGEPLDSSYCTDDLAFGARALMESDCEDFIESNSGLLADWNARQAGHDFWLTRNRHGAGFWDRGRGKNGDDLTAAAHAYGECDLYVGDDGVIYLA